MPTLDGDIHDNNLSGTADADTMSGGLGADTLSGGAGNDVIYGFGAADQAPDSGRVDLHQLNVQVDTPVFAGSPPGDPNHLYVVGVTGTIAVLDVTNDTQLATPFLSIPADQLGTGGERGLLGLAFAPDYQTSGKFYVDLANAQGNIEVWEYQRSASDPNQADPASKRLILTIPHSSDKHYAGWLGFGPDHMLYVSTGDNDAGQTASNPAQDPASLLGKILRIDVSHDDFPDDPNRNYAIPADNPFVGQSGHAPEVYALGLRNPWRESFDPHTGDLYIADVGESSREEIDIIPAGSGGGQNFGWATMEGTLGTPAPGMVPPTLELSHGEGPLNAECIIGGDVYEGPGGAQGLFFFSDFVLSNVSVVRFENGQAEDLQSLDSSMFSDGTALSNTTSFGMDGSGRLYVMTVDGRVFRVTPTAATGDGNDVIHGGDGDDQLYGGAGDDSLTGDGGTNTLSGGLGADTLAAGVGADQLSGGLGNDVFAFAALPTTAGHVTDFTLGSDRLDLMGIMQASGYSGSDPVSDGHLIFQSDGAGGTRVLWDADASGPQAPVLVTTLDHVSPNGLTSSEVLAGTPPPPPPSPPPPPPPPPSSNPGVVLTSSKAGDTLVGGAGDDTLNASQGPDQLTGNGGADYFVFAHEPWAPAHITDFTVGTDRLDISGLLRDAGYAGSDPVADKYVWLLDDGAGGTEILFDKDGTGTAQQWPDYVIDLQHVPAGSATYAQLTANSTTSPPPPSPPPPSPPPPPPPPSSGGQTLRAQDGGSNLQGGAGDDTLIGGHGPDTLTGAGGADHFVFQSVPWSPGEITDFTEGTDKLDVSALLSAAHYAGSDPVGDGYVKLIDDGHGNSWLYFDTDGHGSADPWGSFVATLDHVSSAGFTSADLANGTASPPPPPSPPSPPPPPPPPSSGQTLQAQDGGSTLNGGAGDDTLIGAHGPDQMTGGGGADHFVFRELPWSAATITDFLHATDKIDVSSLLSGVGYSGTDALADGYVKLIDDGHGDSWLYFDSDGHGSADQWGSFVATLSGVAAGSVTASDFIFH